MKAKRGSKRQSFASILFCYVDYFFLSHVINIQLQLKQLAFESSAPLVTTAFGPLSTLCVLGRICFSEAPSPVWTFLTSAQTYTNSTLPFLLPLSIVFPTCTVPICLWFEWSNKKRRKQSERQRKREWEKHKKKQRKVSFGETFFPT